MQLIVCKTNEVMEIYFSTSSRKLSTYFKTFNNHWVKVVSMIRNCYRELFLIQHPPQLKLVLLSVTMIQMPAL